MIDLGDAWPWLASTVLAMGVTLAGCRWRHARDVAQLRQRLLQSEQLRQAEQDRARQARTQITQLNQWVADLQKRLPKEAGAEARRARVEQMVPDLPASSAPALPAHGFADTLPLARRT